MGGGEGGWILREVETFTELERPVDMHRPSLRSVSCVLISQKSSGKIKNDILQVIDTITDPARFEPATPGLGSIICSSPINCL